MDDDDLIRTALLVDADNVNLEVVGEVLRRLDDGSRRLQHRRAYGSLAKAQEFGLLCAQHAIRFLPTTFAGTNGTDIALAIDAIELAVNEPVDEVALVTSDCDFLPLVARLRELGCRVLGYGQKGKSARDIGTDYLRVYDRYEVIDGAPSSKARALPRRAAAKPAGVTALASARRAGAPPATTVTLLRPPEEDEVRRILDAVPALSECKKVELGVAAARLREAGLLAKNASSTRLFSKYPERFELSPASKPNKVLYRPA